MIDTQTTTKPAYLTGAEICAKYNVTDEQIARAHRILNENTGEIFYQVESQTTSDEYELHFNAKYRRVTCNCKAGQAGIPCWHKRAAAAVAFEFRQAENKAYRKEAEEAARYAEMEAQRDAARAAVAGLKAGKGVCQARPFTLLK